MKKLLFVFALFLGVSVNAQSKIENKVKKQSAEMTEVLGLDEETSVQVYDILLEKAQEAARIKKESGGDRAVYKAKVKEVIKPLNNKLSALLGSEKLKEWQTHLKSKKKNK